MIQVILYLCNLDYGKKNIFNELYSFKTKSPNILENVSNNIFRNKYKNRFFYETNSIIAEDSKIFPHIHTIGYARWAMCNDNYNKLDSLLLNYGIDKNIRGYYNRKTKDDVYPKKK